MSQSHLSRTFKETTGFTFIEYVNNIRVKEACTLLNNPRLSVSEITERGRIRMFGPLRADFQKNHRGFPIEVPKKRIKGIEPKSTIPERNVYDGKQTCLFRDH
ncbi:helix-turn-helix domain-containing protein [Fontibacillus sp. BL9]|uniref:helix-turn-helix domain-containing protein n=1 Tax=Fontibacillus sp. BL9 TaxID=3389971 RepID=UPI0039794581